MKVLGIGAAGLGGLGFSATPAAASSHDGPPEPENWQIRYENDFNDGSLDTSTWSVGWGWGTETTQGSMYTDERAITFGDSTLELSILDDQRGDGRYPVGAINTKNKLTVGPGTYMEVRTRAANLPGTTSNFWSKPNTEAWPPEIDIKEVPVRDGNDVNRSIHHVHWTTDGQPEGPHSDLNMGSHGGYDRSEEWTVYGLRWLEDSITYYVNGQEHARTDRSDVMESVNNGAPFYMMLDIMNWPGPELHPDEFSGYKTTHEIDWIRVWEPGSGGGSGSEGTSDDDDSPNEDDDTTDDDTTEDDGDSSDEDATDDDSTDGSSDDSSDDDTTDDDAPDDTSDDGDSADDDGDSGDGDNGDSSDGESSGNDSDSSGDDSSGDDSSGDDSSDGDDSDTNGSSDDHRRHRHGRHRRGHGRRNRDDDRHDRRHRGRRHRPSRGNRWNRRRDGADDDHGRRRSWKDRHRGNHGRHRRRGKGRHRGGHDKRGRRRKGRRRRGRRR